MDSTDKQYFDARLQALSEQIRANQIATDSRFEQFNQTLDFTMKSTLNQYNLKQAEIEAYLQKASNEITKSQSEIVKWVAAISIASAALSITITATLVSQVVPKNPVPIIVYTQPAPPTALNTPAANGSKENNSH